MGEKIGITSTVPVEVIYASGRSAVDINNLFVCDHDPLRFIRASENEGFPRNTCAWIKGLYSAVKEGGINKVIAVVQGDCSNTVSLAERLSADGVEIIPFSYPHGGDSDFLKREIEKLIGYFGTDWKSVSAAKERLDGIRKKIRKIDELTWKDGKVSGFENHIWQVTCSDFKGDPDRFEKETDLFLSEIKSRKGTAPDAGDVRLGVIGVPPIVEDLYAFTENSGARIVYNEVQRQFAMPYNTANIIDQYMSYTYPYGTAKKLADIREQIKRRRLDGLIHYVQSFCHQQIEAEIFRRNLQIPILIVECDKPGMIEGRDKTRIEAFLDSIRKDKRKKSDKSSASIVVGEKRSEDISCGIDIGSRFTKIVFMRGGSVLKEVEFDTIDFYRAYGRRSGGGFSLDISGLGYKPDKVVSTGYGRRNIDFENGNAIPEINAHVAGAAFLSGLKSFTIVDIGGQDVKIISVKDGLIGRFAVNDKCAAGTGRYLENMSRVLGVNVDELGKHYEEPLNLNSACAVFTETELVGKIAAGMPVNTLCASVNLCAYQKIKPNLLKIWEGGPIIVTGGGSKNRGIRYFLEKEFNADIVDIKNPQFAGAIGCALFGTKDDRRGTRDE